MLKRVWVSRMNKIRLTPEAADDLHNIKHYITTELKNPSAAIRIVTKITSDLRALQNFPNAGVSLEAKTGYSTDYRMLVSGQYLIFYRIEPPYVSIDRILNGRQDYLHILFGPDLS